MSNGMKKWLRMAAFAAAGAAVGLVYYRFFGCTTGCAITSSPLGTALYGGLLGWLLSGVLGQKKGA